MAEARVRDIMRTDVPIVTVDDTIGTVARLMAASGLPGIPVVDQGEIMGLITEKDLITRYANIEVPTPVPFLDAIFLLDGGRDFEDDLRHVLAVTAGELMNAPVYNIRDTATLSELATLMIDEDINPVPVIDKSLRLVGIVTRSDLVRAIAQLENAMAESSPTSPSEGAPSST